MNKRSIKILAITTITLLQFGVLAPAKAQEAENKKSPLTREMIQIGFMVALGVTGLAVLLGTGKSMKYKGDGTPIEAEEDIVTESNHDVHNLEKDSEDISGNYGKDLNWEDDAVSGEEYLASNGNGNGNGVTSNGNGNGHNANDMEVATSEEHLVELQKQLYRQRYQKFQQIVHQSPEFANSPTKEVDTWEVDVEVALKVLAESPDDRQEVEKVLLQSDRVKEWESLLPEPEYKAKAAEYIERAYNWAQDLRKWREKHISA